VPASGAELTAADVPRIWGDLFLFGKQTDRAARLEFHVEKSADFADRQAALARVLGDAIGPAESEQATGQVSAIASALSWQCFFPPDTELARRKELVAQQRRDALLTKWPELPLRVLGGRRPSEVATDPVYRVRVLAAILLMELASDSMRMDGAVFNELRRTLGLPTAEEIDVATLVDMLQLPLVRLARVAAEKLSDEQLILCFARSVAVAIPKATQRFAEEIVRRPSLADRMEMASVYGVLSQVSEDDDEALAHVRTARELAVNKGRSPAQWLISELALCLSRGIVDECGSLIQQIQTRHLGEPGVANALMNVLVKYGVVKPDGTPVGEPEEALPEEVSESPAPPTSQLWTPGSPQPAAQPGKSKLWVPGGK
jgi:hypothetical protein